MVLHPPPQVEDNRKSAAVGAVACGGGGPAVCEGRLQALQVAWSSTKTRAVAFPFGIAASPPAPTVPGPTPHKQRAQAGHGQRSGVACRLRGRVRGWLVGDRPGR
jgi:hypothetical protein